jgi:hypothetical protein
MLAFATFHHFDKIVGVNVLKVIPRPMGQTPIKNLYSPRSKKNPKYQTPIKLYLVYFSFVYESNHQPVTEVFTKWAGTGPDNFKSNEHCVHVNENSEWNDISCDHQFRFICEVLL